MRRRRQTACQIRRASRACLLSLIPPAFALGDWRRVSYEDLIAPLIDAHRLLPDPWEAGLVGQYVELLDGVVGIWKAIEAADTDDRWFLTPDVVESLADARLRYLAAKLQAAAMVQRLHRYEAFDGRDFEVGVSNTHALMSFFGSPMAPAHSSRKHHQLGWQFQGEQFRLAVAVRKDSRLRGKSDKLKLAREEYARTHYDDYLDFQDAPAGIDLRGPKNPYRFRHYNPDFVYQYRKVRPDITWGEVEELCVWATQHVLDGTEEHL